MGVLVLPGGGKGLMWCSSGTSPPYHLPVVTTYKIVRGYFRGGRRTIKRGLTLEEAQAHCRNPETSSRTATSAAAKRRTA